jgi:hypothetical protein
MEKRQIGQDEKVSFLKPKEGETLETKEGKVETDNFLTNLPRSMMIFCSPRGTVREAVHKGFPNTPLRTATTLTP